MLRGFGEEAAGEWGVGLDLGEVEGAEEGKESRFGEPGAKGVVYLEDGGEDIGFGEAVVVDSGDEGWGEV